MAGSTGRGSAKRSGNRLREKSVAAENSQAGHRSSTVFQQRRFGTTRKWVAGGVRAGLDRSEDAGGAPSRRGRTRHAGRRRRPPRPARPTSPTPPEPRTGSRDTQPCRSAAADRAGRGAPGPPATSAPPDARHQARRRGRLGRPHPATRRRRPRSSTPAPAAQNRLYAPRARPDAKARSQSENCGSWEEPQNGWRSPGTRTPTGHGSTGS